MSKPEKHEPVEGTVETLLQAALLACDQCGGKKKVYTGMGFTGLSGGAEYERCPGCQDADGKPTGRQFPSLSRECPCIAGIRENASVWVDIDTGEAGSRCDRCTKEHESDCEWCQGLGRVPVLNDRDWLDQSAEKAGYDLSCSRLTPDPMHPSEQYEHGYAKRYTEFGEYRGYSFARLAACREALAAVLVAVWPEE